MKIQAVSASFPYLDWRAVHPGTRIPAIDPKRLGREPFLKGFGRCGYRSTVSIPWRESETVFFEANRGIQLPSTLPGGNAAVQQVRRAYLAGLQVRFDLALFARMRPRSLRDSRYKEAARRWWSAPLQIRDRNVWQVTRLAEATRKLGERFRDETSLRSAPADEKHERLSILPQQICIMGFLPRRDIPPEARLLLEEPRVWLMSSPNAIKHQPQPDVSFVFVEELMRDDAADRISKEQFQLLRRIRRELIWLHADVQLLLEIGRALAREPSSCCTPILLSIAQEVSKGLSQLDRDEAWGFEPLLLAAWCDVRANDLALWRSQVGKGISSRMPLPEWLTNAPRQRIAERRRIYLQTVRHRLSEVRNTYPTDSALQLGKVALVERGLLEGHGMPVFYGKERASAFATYFGLPSSERISMSVVVPVRGGAFPLVACLESIATQVLVKDCPQDVELVIVEDGVMEGKKSVFQSHRIEKAVRQCGMRTRCYQLTGHRGRAVARNVGLLKASSEIVMFVDASMVLDRFHLAEHAIRHHRIPNIALLGFKENLKIDSPSSRGLRMALRSIDRAPDPRRDWKWDHVIVPDEVDENELFRFRNVVKRVGDRISFMEMTNYLRDVAPDEKIGSRSLATFFQTNIVSVPARALKEVGGFHSRAFRDGLWGLEDSHVGALLLAAGVFLVPCPSATAFKIEHAEPVGQREFDLPRHRELYEELLGERMRQRAHESEGEVRELEARGELQEVRVGDS